MSGLSLGLNLGLARVSGKGGPPAKTYADFQAHIATLTANTYPWSANYVPAGKNRTTCGAATGTMIGTTWLSVAEEGSLLSRMVQHGLPSPAEFTSQSSGGREVYFEISYGSASVFNALNRNGYLSAASTGVSGANSMTFLLYFVDGVGAYQTNPSTGTGPTPYPIP